MLMSGWRRQQTRPGLQMFLRSSSPWPELTVSSGWQSLLVTQVQFSTVNMTGGLTVEVVVVVVLGGGGAGAAEGGRGPWHRGRPQGEWW